MSITIATASYDRKLCFWEAGTGRCIKQLAFQESQVNCMTISPDRVRLAVGGFGVIKIFDITPPITTNQHQAAIGTSAENSHTQCVTALVYVQLATTAPGADLRPSSSSSAAAASAASAASLLLSTSEDGHIKLWDPRPATLRLRRDIDTKSAINCAALHPQQTLLFVGSQLGFVSVWSVAAIAAPLAGSASMLSSGAANVAGGAEASHPIQQLPLEDNCAVRSIAVSPLGNLVCAATNAGRVHCMRAAGGPSGTLILLPAHTISSQQSFERGPAGGCESRRSDESVPSLRTGVPDETTPTASREGLDALDTTAVTPPQQQQLSNGAGAEGVDTALSPLQQTSAFSPAGGESTAASAAQESVSKTTPTPPLLLVGGQPVLEIFHVFRAHHKYILKAVISPNGKLLATASADYSVSLWAVPPAFYAAARDSSAALTGSGSVPTSGELRPAGGNNATASSLESTSAAHSPTSQASGTFPAAAAAATAAAAAAPTTGTSSGGGSTVATPVVQAAAASPSPARDSLAASLNGPSAAAAAAAAAAASAGSPPAAFPLFRTLTGHQRWVWDCAFSSCSHFIVSASSDHTGRLWDLHSGKLVVAFSGHAKPVNCVVLDDRPAPK